MLVITVEVDAPSGSAQGVKEALAQFCDYFGDSRVVSIKEVQPEQMRIDYSNKKRGGEV